jgi:hypothetical protein
MGCPRRCGVVAAAQWHPVAVAQRSRARSRGLRPAGTSSALLAPAVPLRPSPRTSRCAPAVSRCPSPCTSHCAQRRPPRSAFGSAPVPRPSPRPLCSAAHLPLCPGGGAPPVALHLLPASPVGPAPPAGSAPPASTVPPVDPVAVPAPRTAPVISTHYRMSLPEMCLLWNPARYDCTAVQLYSCVLLSFESRVRRRID